ncbi:MAG: DUF5683 domain-containing protein [Cyclobacteriaceae bacterium]|jgi:hypothetical protein|nr:DUF5683 domain-containing protein [Cyclobacteriaceae bacterium]
MRTWAISIGCMAMAVCACAQEVAKPDSVVVETAPASDSLRARYAARFSPRKALLYSAIFPGMGQAYNRKYWKTPLVWGGFGLTVGIAMFYDEQYQRYRKDLFGALADGRSTGTSTGFTVTQLRRNIERARRERDFFIIISGFWYILQMVDAHVDAHLKEFDLNPQLKLGFEPRMESSPWVGRSAGVALVLRF